MMPELKDYVDNGGLFCPWCRSKDIAGKGNILAVSSGATQEIECNNCHKRWTDVYCLVNIYYTDEQGRICSQ